MTQIHDTHISNAKCPRCGSRQWEENTASHVLEKTIVYFLTCEDCEKEWELVTPKMTITINLSMEVELPFTIEEDKNGSSGIIEKDGKFFLENYLEDQVIKSQELTEKEASALLRDCFMIIRSTYIG